MPDGATADVILAAARTPEGISLFAVPGTAEGLTRSPQPAMDQTRKQARLDFAAAGGRLIGADSTSWDVVARGLRRAMVGLAAEQAGGAQRVLDMMVGHSPDPAPVRPADGGLPGGPAPLRGRAGQRRGGQVGRVLRPARRRGRPARPAPRESQGRLASRRESELAAVASLAKAFCSEAYRHAADAAIQVFGGIALTWEHPVQLYFKRARSSEVLLGAPAYHRELLARHLAL